MLNRAVSKVVAAAMCTAALTTAPALCTEASDDTTKRLTLILRRVTAIEKDLCESGAPTRARVRYTSDDNMPALDTDSLLGRHLTSELYESLYRLRTSFGWSVDQSIQEALDSHSNDVVAGDAESFTTFSDLLLPLLEELHPATENVTDTDSTHITVSNPDPAHEFVTRYQIRAHRNLAAFAFTPNMIRAERRAVATTVKTALSSLPDLNFSFEDVSASKWAAGGGLPRSRARDFPDGRELAQTPDFSTVVAVNFDSHVSVACTTESGNLKGLFHRWDAEMKQITDALATAGASFAHDKKLGFLAPDLVDVGTGFTVNVGLRVPKILASGKLQELMDEAGFELGGESTESEVVVACRAKLGTSEVEAANQLLQFVADCVKAERACVE